MARILYSIVTLLAAMGIASIGHARTLSPEEQQRVEASLSEFQSDTDPGFAIGIVRDGEIVFEAYSGLAEVSHSIPLGPSSRLNIASNAKQYVALMALDLADQGAIDLEADFRTYLPGSMPLIAEPITVSNLITHTSGIRDIYGLWALTGVTWYERPFRNRDAMELLNRQFELNFAPGTDYLYSNSNYILLAELIANVTSQRFNVYAREFFDRLGMPETGWKRRYGAVLANEANAYNNWNGWLENPAIAYLYGDGFLYTTLRDQLAWEQQIQGAGSSLNSEVISLSQQRQNPDLPGNYGFGLEHGTFLQDPSIYHSGGTGGFNAYVLRLPQSQIAIVVMGNSSQIDVSGLAQLTAASLLDAPPSEIGDYPAGPSEILARPDNADVIGRYETNDGTIITIRESEVGLTREIEGRDPVVLQHEDGNVFFYQTLPDLKIVFDLANDGQRRFRLFMPTQPVATALEVADPPSEDLRKVSLEGCYINEETGTEIVIDWVDGLAFTMTKNGRTRDASMIGGDYLRWNSYRLRFERNEIDQVSMLWVDNNRIRNVRFEPSATCS